MCNEKKSIFHFVKGSLMSMPFFQSFNVQCRFADPYQKHILLSHESVESLGKQMKAQCFILKKRHLFSPSMSLRPCKRRNILTFVFLQNLKHKICCIFCIYRIYCEASKMFYKIFENLIHRILRIYGIYRVKFKHLFLRNMCSA